MVIMYLMYIISAFPGGSVHINKENTNVTTRKGIVGL